MITDILDMDIVKVLTFYSLSPGSNFTRKDIKENTMMNNVPLDKALNILLMNKILCKNKRLLSLNFENAHVRIIMDMVRKEYVRFKYLPLNIFYALSDISSRFSCTKSIYEIFLFGSYAKLTHDKDSDVNIAVITDISDKAGIRKYLAKVEKKYNLAINAHYFTKKNMASNISLVKDIKKNGVNIL